MRLVSTSVLSMVLNATIELDVFEILAKAGRGAQLSPQKNASHIPDKNPDAPAVLDRMQGSKLATQFSFDLSLMAVEETSKDTTGWHLWPNTLSSMKMVYLFTLC